MYKWVLVNSMLGVTLQQTCTPSRGRTENLILLVTLFDRNQDMCWPDGLLGLYADLNPKNLYLPVHVLLGLTCDVSRRFMTSLAPSATLFCIEESTFLVMYNSHKVTSLGRQNLSAKIIIFTESPYSMGACGQYRDTPVQPRSFGGKHP